MRRQDPIFGVDDDDQPVIVPRSDKSLVATSPERVRRLKENLARALLASRTVTDPRRSVSPSLPKPDGFAARVARAACSLCKGWCCRNGEDDAFLDERTMARVLHETPRLDADGALRLYLDRVPAVGYAGSCIFHGKQGCSLEPSLRSDTCNNYFCGGLDTYLRSGDPAAPVVIFAGEGEKMRSSPVLIP